MIRRLRAFVGAGETVLALAAAWVLVFAVPFRRTAAGIGRVSVPAGIDVLPPPVRARARYVCRRTARIARRVPWRTSCLVQAVAGWMLLKRRGIAATIRLGVKQDAGSGSLAAHAWLIVGGETVLGGAAAEGFAPLADMGARAARE